MICYRDQLIVIDFWQWKRKLEYKGHLVFKEVTPALVLQFLEFLKSHYYLYSDNGINLNKFPVDELGCQNNMLREIEMFSQLLRCLDEPIEVKMELSTDKSMQEDPMYGVGAPSVELHPYVRAGNS